MNDKRLQFVNALASYLDCGRMPFPVYKTNLSAIEDACNHLRDDNERMPPTFHHVMKTLCDHEVLAWRSSSGNWSSAVRIANYYFQNYRIQKDGNPIPRGGWRTRSAHRQA